MPVVKGLLDGYFKYWCDILEDVLKWLSWHTQTVSVLRQLEDKLNVIVFDCTYTTKLCQSGKLREFDTLMMQSSDSLSCTAQLVWPFTGITFCARHWNKGTRCQQGDIGAAVRSGKGFFKTADTCSVFIWGALRSVQVAAFNRSSFTVNPPTGGSHCFWASWERGVSISCMMIMCFHPTTSSLIAFFFFVVVGLLGCSSLVLIGCPVWVYVTVLPADEPLQEVDSYKNLQICCSWPQREVGGVRWVFCQGL